jgi:hypothetical protein
MTTAGLGRTGPSGGPRRWRGHDEMRHVAESPLVASALSPPSWNSDEAWLEREAASVRCRLGWSPRFATKLDKRMVPSYATKHEKENEIRERARGHLFCRNRRNTATMSADSGGN